MDAFYRSEKTNKRLIIVAIALLCTALLLFAGLASAYFSDMTEKSGTVKSGTLKIEGNYTYYMNGIEIPSLNITNLNPGDALTISAVITNNGNKSAWIREKISLISIDEELIPFFNIYIGNHSQSDLKTLDLSEYELEIGAGGEAVSSDRVINGTGSGAETETQESTGKDYDFIGNNTYTAYLTVYFSHNATNVAQDKSFTLSVMTQALQFRNNYDSKPSEIAWSSL